ncbi:hypothetical protein [Hymenobacter sp.]|jgi:hypothetical protein|uniref:hypothetical protein n=1 Tax=Hymenobacter sp. TaxID=1898978 RepID=UPI002ED8869B
MPRSAYQKQADSRTRTALRLRARADAKVRKYAVALVAALVNAADAKARLDRINLLYGVDISTETLLAHDVRTAGLGEQLANLLAASGPGEEVQLFNPAVNRNEGALLANEAVFGEPVAAGSVPPSTPVTPTNGGGTAAISVSKLRAVRVDETTWNVQVQASSPSGSYHLVNDVLPYAYDFQNQNEMSFSFFDMQAGQQVNFTFTDSINSQVTLQRTLVLE